MLRRILPLALLSLGLGACSVAPPVTALTPRVTPAVPEPQPMTLRPVHWQVVGKTQMLALIQKAPAGTVWYVLDADNFRAERLNEIEISRYVQEQHTVIVLLRQISGADAAPSPTAIPSPTKAVVH